ncbi:MAG: hypothetical protein ACXWJW_15340 [Xanthobacteraceae bacterium]
MRASTYLATIPALLLVMLSISSAANAQPFSCELYATAIERIPCYYARAAQAAGPAYRYDHRSWKRHAVRRHARADARYYQR